MSEIVQKLGFDATKAISNLNKLSEAIDKANESMIKMGKTAASSGIKSVTKNTKEAGESAKTAASKFKGLSDSLARLNLGTQAIRMLGRAFKDSLVEATKFGLKVAEIQTIGGDLQMTNAEISASVRDISSSIGVVATDVAEGLYQTLSNQVVDAADAFGILEKAQRLAKITASQTKDAINAVSSVMNSYGKSAAEADTVMDSLFKTVELGRLRLADIADILGRVTPLTAQMGVEWTEAAAAIAVMTRQGVKADTAVTQLRAIMQKIIKPTEDMTKLFRSWGVKDGPDAIKTFGGLQAVLVKMSKEVAGSNIEMAKFFRRVRAIVGEMSLLNNDGKLMAETMAEIEDSAGAANAAWEQFSETDAHKLTVAWTEFKNTLIAVGEALTPIASFTVDVVAQMVKVVGDASNSFIGWLAPAYKEVQRLEESMESAKQTIKDFVAAPPITMFKEWKKASQEALQSLIPLKKEFFRLTDASSRAVQRHREVFNDYLKNLSDSYEKAFKGLDKLVKKLDGVRKKSSSKIEGIERAADQRGHDRKVRNSRSEFKARQLDATRFSKFQSKLFKAAQTANLSDPAYKTAQADAGVARKIAEEQELAAEARGNRAEASRWAGRQKTLDNQLVKLERRRVADAGVLAGKAALLNDELKKQAAEVKAVTKEMQAQVKLREEARAKPGAAAKSDVKAYDKSIQESIDKLKTLKFTEAHKAMVAALGLDPSEMSRINNEIEKGLDFHISNLSLDVIAIQAELDRKTFEIKVSIKVDDTALNAKALGIDIEGFKPFDAREKVNKGATKAFEADRAAQDKIHSNQEAINGLMSSYEKSQDAQLGNHQRVIQTLEDNARLQREYGWTSDQIEKSRAKAVKNTVGDETRAYIDRISHLDNIAKRQADGQVITNKELLKEKQAISELEGLQRQEFNFLNQKLALLGQVNDYVRQNKELQKEVLGDADRQAVQSQLAISKEIVLTEEEKVAAIKLQKETQEKATSEMEASSQAASKVKVNLDKAKGATDNMKTSMSNVKQEASNTSGVIQGQSSVVNGVIGVVNNLAKAWNEVAKAAAAAKAAGAGAAPAYFGGTFMNAGGIARGQDTIPAVLAKGETVVDQRNSSRFFSQLNAMNQGSQPVYREQGGPVTNVGDVNVTVNGGGDSQQTVREIGRGLRREIQRGTIKLN